MNISASNFITIGVPIANARCTLLVDSGADISIFKLSKIHPTQPVNTNIRKKLTGITDGEIEI